MHVSARAGASTPGGTLAGRPADWTQPLTPRQVVQQANALVQTAYQPANAELNLVASQQNGILAKQEADNQYYQNWLDSKSSALLANQHQVESATNALESQLTGDQASAFGAQSGQLTAAANATPGNVNNNAASFTPGQSALGDALGANRSGLSAELGGAAKQALSVENTESSALGAATLNTGAAIEAGQSKEIGAFNNAMMKIAQSRASLGTHEGADLEKEIARLQGIQINLSENNRNFATAAQRLGIQAANVGSQIQSRAGNLKVAQGKLAVSQGQLALGKEKLAHTISQDQIKNMQDATKLGLEAIRTKSEVALHQAQIFKDTHGGRGLTPHEVQTYVNGVYSVTGELNGLIGQGMNPNEAYNALLQGGYQLGRKWVHVKPVFNQSLLNAGYNARAGGPGLSSGDIGYLTRLGITNISNYFPVAGQGQPGPGRTTSPGGGGRYGGVS